MNSGVNISIIDPDELDLQQYCLLQQKAFAQLLHKNKVSDDFITPAFFQWKYHAPAGKAKVALAIENGQMLASVAMYPVYLISKGTVFKSWHFTDAAVLPFARESGLFPACMNILINSLLPGEMIYVFPNQHSMKGTMRLGFEQQADLSFYVKFLLNQRVNQNYFSKQIITYASDQDTYAKTISSANGIMLYKDAAYMNWRYRMQPHAKYYAFSATANHLVTGNVVVRPVVVKGVKLLLMMELHAADKTAQQQLLAFVHEVAAIEKCSMAGLFSAGNKSLEFLSNGFIYIPAVLLPKKQRMMGYLKKMSGDGYKYNWFSQTGDWDAF